VNGYIGADNMVDKVETWMDTMLGDTLYEATYSGYKDFGGVKVPTRMVEKQGDYPTLDVNVDRERAGLLGTTMADVSRSLVTATSSSRYVVPNYWADANTGIASTTLRMTRRARWVFASSTAALRPRREVALPSTGTRMRLNMSPIYTPPTAKI